MTRSVIITAPNSEWPHHLQHAVRIGLEFDFGQLGIHKKSQFLKKYIYASAPEPSTPSLRDANGFLRCSIHSITNVQSFRESAKVAVLARPSSNESAAAPQRNISNILPYWSRPRATAQERYKHIVCGCIFFFIPGLLNIIKYFSPLYRDFEKPQIVASFTAHVPEPKPSSLLFGGTSQNILATKKRWFLNFFFVCVLVFNLLAFWRRQKKKLEKMRKLDNPHRQEDQLLLLKSKGKREKLRIKNYLARMLKATSFFLPCLIRWPPILRRGLD